jgi:hypothetical protein
MKKVLFFLKDISRGLLNGRQVQYVSRFIDNTDPNNYPNLGNGLVFKNIFKDEKVTGSYHDYKIYKDDIGEFIKRVKEYYGEK